MKNKSKSRPSDIIALLGLLLIIYGFAAAMIITPDKSFSEEENRPLQGFPKFSPESLTSGKFTADIATYFSDQMPLRDLFVGAKGITEAAMLKSENNSVILGKDGNLIEKQDYNEFTSADKNIAAINKFAKAAAVPVYTAIAGRKQDVLTDAAPTLYPAKKISDEALAYVNTALTEPQNIDIITPLRDRASLGEYVYYRTDHHWTSLGAYYAYRQIMKSFGMEAYPLEYFTRETVTEDFYGTTWSKSGMKWVGPEPIEYFRYTGDDTLEVKIGGKVTSGLYDRSYLQKKSKYSSFIGETFALASVYPTEGSPLSGEREKLLIIKDSFAHSIAPFLALHFDIELIDLRYYKASTVVGYVQDNGIDRVLILCNMDSLLNETSLSAVSIGPTE